MKKQVESYIYVRCYILGLVGLVSLPCSPVEMQSNVNTCTSRMVEFTGIV